MTGKEFLRKVSNGQGDILQVFLDLLKAHEVTYCVMGGLAVNAYAEPVVSLDLDVIIVAEQLDAVRGDLQGKYKVEAFPHSLNLSDASSDLRIQIQMDPRYQAFLDRAMTKDVLGYTMPVACIDDVFQGKVWAAMDHERRPSKRQKDLADIQRLIESEPRLRTLVPAELQSQLLSE